MDGSNDCIFCKIIKKELPAKVVYEDDLILAFDDINPQAPVHTLIIPKKHFSSLNETTLSQQALLGHIFVQAKKIAKKKGVGESGYRIVLKTGCNAIRTVFHIHFHILGGRRMTWPPG